MAFSSGIGSVTENVTADDSVIIGDYSLLRDVHLGRGVRVWNFCNLYGCKLGANTHVGSYTQIGKDSSIGEFCRIHDGVSIPSQTTIGKYVFVGAKTVFANDRFPTVQKTLARTYEITPVRVMDYAAIGMGAVISAGVTIGKNALIGAGSIVIRDVPEHAIVVGNPARVIGDVRDKKYEHYNINNGKYFINEDRIC